MLLTLTQRITLFPRPLPLLPSVWVQYKTQQWKIREKWVFYSCVLTQMDGKMGEAWEQGYSKVKSEMKTFNDYTIIFSHCAYRSHPAHTWTRWGLGSRLHSLFTHPSLSSLLPLFLFLHFSFPPSLLPPPSLLFPLLLLPNTLLLPSPQPISLLPSHSIVLPNQV